MNSLENNKKSMLAMAVAVVISQPLAAQNQMLEEVLVTAQKKSNAEAAQDVPVAISAFNGDQIDALFAETINDLGKSAPNVGLQEVGTYPGIANFSIRGMGLASSLASDEPTVGTIVDGMYLGVNYGVTLDTFDLEAVELLRGPQGTLFGRNVTGGAVVVRTRRPGEEFGFRAKGVIGSDERRDLAVSIEGPLNDELAAKLVVSHKDHDGYFDNLSIPGDKIGERKSLVVRPKLLWSPSDSVDVLITAEYGDISGDGASTRVLDDAGTLSYLLGHRAPADPAQLTHNFPSTSDLQWQHLIAETNWDIGEGTLTSITAWRDVESAAGVDTDGTPITIAHLEVDVEQQQFSQELRYAGLAMDGNLEYTAGLYYFTQEVTAREYRDLSAVSAAVPSFPAIMAARGETDHWAAAIFAQADYALSDAWTLTLGVRYGTEEKEAVISPLGACDAAIVNCAVVLDDSERWNNLSPKLGISWQALPDMLVYASATRGFRSGGFSFRQANAYDEESVDAFELGVKSDWLGKRLRVNASVFLNEFSDLQRTVLDPVTTAQTVQNAAEATMQGIELELIASPIDSLVITASLGYLDASYDSFSNLAAGLDADGLAIERAPEWNRAVAVLYDMDIGDAGTLTWRVSYSFTDERPVNTFNSAFHEAYEVVDASVTWMGPDEQYSVSLFGKNLMDEIYADTGADTFVGRVDYLQPPRTWGVSFSYDY